MRRVVCVFLPTWPIDRLRRNQRLRPVADRCAGQVEHPGRTPAILLVQVDHGREIVAGCCPRSTAVGVRPGMTVAQARALIGHDRVVIAPHQPQADAAALHKLAGWAVRFSPLVASDPPDGLLLDVSGCVHLYGGERRMLNAIGNALDRLGFANRLACAGTIGCAWAAARFDSQGRCAIEPGLERQAIETLPVAALRIDQRIIEALREVNVDRVGQVLAIPRLELATRFESDLLRRIDQALGDAAEVMEPIRPREPVVAERGFEGAVIDIETLGIVTRELLDEVAAALARREAGAVRLILTLTRLDATPVRLDLRLSRPSRDIKHLWSLLRPRIETVHLGFGVERMTLQTQPARQPKSQTAMFGGSAARQSGLDRAAGELIDTLAHRLGTDRALRMDVVESHQPDRVATFAPAMNGSAAPSPAMVADVDQPSILLDQPEMIEAMAMTPEGAPIWLRWRGQEHRIVASQGPRRISGEWWRGTAETTGQRNRVSAHAASSVPSSLCPSITDHPARDYFKVQDNAGRWLWIYRMVASGGWFVHGEWA